MYILYADISEPTVYQTISGLVDAYRDYSGESAKSFSTDAANKAIPNTVVTNLIDDTRHAIKIKTKKKKKNAAYGLTLGRIDKGVQRARDYSGGGVVKEVSDFTVDESFKSNFLYDYLANFIKYSTDPNIQTPIFAANPSDKSQVLKEMTDLSNEITVKNVKINFNKLTVDEKKDLVSNLLSKDNPELEEALTKLINRYNDLAKTIPFGDNTTFFRLGLSHKKLSTADKVLKNLFDFTPEEIYNRLYVGHTYKDKKANEKLEGKVKELQYIVKELNRLEGLHKNNKLIKAIKDPDYVLDVKSMVKPLYKYNEIK